MFMKVSSDFCLIRVGLGTEKFFQLGWNQKQKKLKVDILLYLNKVYSGCSEIRCGGRTKFWGGAHVRRAHCFLEGT